MADDINRDDDIVVSMVYDDTGEKAAIKGAENVGKAIEETGKKAKNTGATDLKTLESGLLKVGTASNSVANGQKKVSDALSSTVAKLQAQNTALRETVAQFSKVTSMSGHRSVSAKMASSSGLGVDVEKFAAAPAVQSGMDYRKHLKNINSVTTQLEKYTQKTITSVAAIEKKTQAEVKNIAKMKTTESQLAAVAQLEKNLSSTILETSNTLSNTSVVTANFSKNLDGLVKVTEDDSDAIKKLKNNTVDSYNAFEASNRVLQEHRTILTTLREKTATYRKELQEKQKLEKETAGLTNEQQKITLLDQQNQRLAIAKAEFDAMSTAAEKYKNTFEVATRVGAKGYIPMATNVPYTPTGAELTSKLTDMGGNYAELKKVTDARQQSTAALISEAAQFAKNAKEADSYEDKLKFTEMATEKLKEASLANKSALFDIGTLANQTGANLKTYTKYIQDNDTATLALKNGVVDLSNQLIDSRDGLRAQSKGIMENITNLNNERKSIIANIKAQKELEEARLRTQASQNAMTQLQGMPKGIGGVTSNLAAQQGVNSSALADAQGFLAAADATNVYKDKLKNLDSAYNVVNSAMEDNKLAMASAKLTMEPLLAAYAEFKGDLDETDPKAKALKDTIEAMKKAYEDNVRAMRGQGIELEHMQNSIVAGKEKVEAATKVIEDSHNKVRSGLQETANIMRTIGMSLTRYVTAPLIAAGVQAVKFTAEMEMNIKSLQILLGNNEKAADQLYAQVVEYAAKTPYEIPDLTSATKQLLAFGSASGDVMKELSMLGDLAQNDSDKLESITSAFGKVQARGVAHMRELNRFIMAGVPIIQALGEVLKKDSESLFKAVEAGQVGFDAVKQSIQLLTSEGERFYKMSEILSQTVKGRWSTLSDEVNLALKSFVNDSMDSILKIINKVISLAEAIQALAPSQRTAIKNWAIMAASLGPVLFGLTKILSIANSLSSIGEHFGLAGAKLGAMVGGPILAGVLAVVGVIAGLYLKSKAITKEYEKQGKIIDDMVVNFTKLSANGGAPKDVIEAYARELRDAVAPDVKVPVIMDIIMNEPDNAKKKLQELQGIYDDYAKAKKKLEKEKEKEEEEPGMSILGGYGWYTAKKRVAAAEAEVERLSKKLNDTIQESSTATTVMGWFKKKFGVTDAAVTDVSGLLNAFKYNTEEAINGTLAQFERFYSIVPNIEGAKSAMAELRTVMSDALKSEAKTFSEKQFRDILEKSGITEGTAAYTLMKFLLTPGEQGLAAAMDMFDEVFDKLPEFTKGSIDSFKKATEETFEKENLVEFWFSNKAFTDSPDLIAKRAKALADMYTSIVESAASIILRDKPGLSLQEALEMVKAGNADLFIKWEDSLNTASVADAYSELAGLISSYNKQIAEVDVSEVEKFNNKVDALLNELVDTTYYDKVKNSISGLKQNFATLKFKEVEADLIAQKNALLLTSDALDELTYRQNHFTSAQIEGLRQLKSYTNTIKELQEISGSGTASIPLLDELSKVSGAISAYSTSPWGKSLDLDTDSTVYSIETKKQKSLTPDFKEPTEFLGMTKEDYIALGNKIPKTFKSITKEIFEADEATKRLIYSSKEYAVFMSTLAANKNFSELFSDASTDAMVDKVTEALKAQQDFYDGLGKKEYTPIEDIFGTFTAADLQKAVGMTQFGKGNIDLSNRPKVDLGNGSIGTILSESFGVDGFEVLVPRIVNGMVLSAEEALQHYLNTGEYLMRIDTSKMTSTEVDAAREEMDEYAELLHKYEEYRIDMIGVQEAITSTVGKALSKDIADRTDVDLKSLEAWEKFTDVMQKISDLSAADPSYDSTVDSMTALVTLINTLQGITTVTDKWEGFKDTLKGIGEELRNMAFEGLINSIEAVGEAWGSGTDMGEAFTNSIGDMVKAIIDALPQLLLNAGLKLINDGNPWGWALIAASGVAALGKGYVNGRVNGSKDGTTTASNLNFSAKGDSFDRGRILNMPTIFNTASGLNIGGELGTEAILPLSRDSSGRLGVNVAGSGGGNTIAVPVTVNIVNQSGVETEAEVSETTNADGGKNIEVIIKRIVNNGMANGEYDRTMKSRYGLSNRGVS